VTSLLSSYVYAIVPSDTVLPDDLYGVEGNRVALEPYHELAAVVGHVDVERPLRKRADVMAHGRVLDVLAAHGAVIPVRFGALLADDSEVVDGLLAPQAEHLLEVLDGLRGRAQFTLRARYDEPTVLTEVVAENADIEALRDQTRGRPEDATYAPRVRMGELVAQALESKREADGKAVLDALLPHVVASRVLPGAGIDLLVDVAFLVDDDRRAAFEEAAEDVAASVAPRATVRLVGPVAPYDFVPEE
jgi:hypothetical protein